MIDRLLRVAWSAGVEVARTIDRPERALGWLAGIPGWLLVMVPAWLRACDARHNPPSTLEV